MSSYSLSHLSDGTLLHDLTVAVAKDRRITAALLAHLAEVDARRLYAPAGYPSMHAYCVQELHLSKDAAYKRIQAARAAREFPALFAAVAGGGLHLSAVCLIAPHLTVRNAVDLLTAAAGKSKSEIEELLAHRYPRSERLAVVEQAQEPIGQLAPGQVGPSEPPKLEAAGRRAAAPAGVHGHTPKVAPVARERYALQLTIGQGTHDKLRHAQALLSHNIPNGDLAAVLDRILDLAIERLEKRKFASGSKHRAHPGRSTNPRYIPAHVRNAVWQRDGGRCTFVSNSGRRCPARDHLEFDHITPVARGGRSSVEGIRLRCRTHNQYEAARAFGNGFMKCKREARQVAARARAAAKGRAEREQEEAEAEARRALAKEKAQEVIPYLRALGFRADEARWRAERCETIPEASLEARVRLALSHVSPRIASQRGVALSKAPPARPDAMLRA